MFVLTTYVEGKELLCYEGREPILVSTLAEIKSSKELMESHYDQPYKIYKLIEVTDENQC